MNCQEVEQNLFDFCDNNVSSALKELIGLHLNSCHSCRNSYRLTRDEKDALRDPSGIPVLPPNFTAMVINSLPQDDLYPVTTVADNIPPASIFKVYPRFLSLTAVAAAIVALCIYAPNLIRTGDEVNIATTTSEQRESFSVPISAPAADSVVSVEVDQLKGVQPKAAVPSATDKAVNTQTKAGGSQPSLLSAPAVSALGGGPLPENTDDPAVILQSPTREPITNYTLENIPLRFHLDKINSENVLTEYNYKSTDGQDSLQIVVIVNKVGLVPDDLNNQPPSPFLDPIIERQVTLGDQSMTVTFSGTLSVEDLKAIADQVQFKSTARK